MRLLIAAVAAMMLAGCATQQSHYVPAPGEKMHITERTMNGFNNYLADIGSVNPGYFAVSASGRSYEYWYCHESYCSDMNAFAYKALRDCEQYGEKCYIFAQDRNIKVDYQVVP
jgi:hypothetical protein